ncbi:MAG: VWA domain-containing protein [Acidimicrobiales bacterium]|nr:VWA domain-containing protein [Acidimicrobiales bacterium]
MAELAVSDLLVEFGHELREAGMAIGSGDVVTYCTAVAALDPTDLVDLYWAGRTTLVTRRDQITVYDRVFRHFFLGEDAPGADVLQTPTDSVSGREAVLQIPDSEPGDESSEEDEAQLGLVASGSEVWRNKAFSACTPEELAALRRIMARTRLRPPQRRTRRSAPTRSGRRLDARRMARETMRMHGEPGDLLWLRRKLRIRPVVLILDVSGSMSDYSRNLLQFAHSARRASDRVEVFCFGTRLTRITKALDRRRADDAMARAADEVFDWDGGTRIGDSLDEFVRRWGRRGTSRGAIVVICSDGLDRGDPAVLAGAMERLHRLSHRVVWMNPHKGDDPEFRPTSLAMMVAAPHIDIIVSGHNLRSLEEFATMLPELR